MCAFDTLAAWYLLQGFDIGPGPTEIGHKAKLVRF